MEKRSKSYLQLIKPGITISNSMAALAGFLLAASTARFDWLIMFAGVGGTGLLIASACVFNNIIDRPLDARMKRTSKRELVTGSINTNAATLYLVALGSAGFTLLALYTNQLTVILGCIAYIWYVAVYGIAKRTTVFSTIIGAVAGALPPVAGYTALTGEIDAAAILLFCILFFWQMPHFYAIAIFRRKDYKSANIPVWTVKRSVASLKPQMLIFAALFGIASLLLFNYGYVGWLYLIVMILLIAYWFIKIFENYGSDDHDKWARQVFGASLVVLPLTCLMIAIGGWIV